MRKFLGLVLKDIDGRSEDELKKSYLDKTDGKAPSHIIFVCMLIRICEKDKKTAPLFNWLVKNFGAELGTMHEPQVIKKYTTKIGMVYFAIQPPPSMMAMMENMMSVGRYGRYGWNGWWNASGRNQSTHDADGYASYAGWWYGNVNVM